MYSRYLRSYPWWLQLILLVLMVFIMLSLMTAVMYALPKFTGVSLTDITNLNEHSPRVNINTAILFQAISSIGIFLLSALLFAYLAHPRPAYYLGIRKPGKNIQWLLVTGLILGAMPLMVGLDGLLQKIDLGESARLAQKQSDDMTNAFLNMPSFSYFIVVFVVMAVIPAIGEELFFRGVLLRFAKQRSRTMTMPVVVTAIVFAMSHTSVYGLPSIFLAGVLLAVIYYLTGSILCSMLAHMLNNGLQIILVYMAKDNTGVKHFMESNTMPVPLMLGGLILFLVCLYLLIKNKTPLPADWASDFRPDELAEA